MSVNLMLTTIFEKPRYYDSAVDWPVPGKILSNEVFGNAFSRFLLVLLVQKLSVLARISILGSKTWTNIAWVLERIYPPTRQIQRWSIVRLTGFDVGVCKMMRDGTSFFSCLQSKLDRDIVSLAVYIHWDLVNWRRRVTYTAIQYPWLCSRVSVSQNLKLSLHLTRCSVSSPWKYDASNLIGRGSLSLRDFSGQKGSRAVLFRNSSRLDWL